MIPLSEKDKPILFWVPGGMALMLHTEGALALALSYRDVNVHAVICDGVYKACMLRNKTISGPVESWGCQGSSEAGLSCQQCKANNASVLEQMGVPYSFIGDYITESDLVESSIIARKQTWINVKNLTVDGIALGNKITASVIRYYQGLYNSVDENVVYEYSRSALICAVSARNCIKKICPTRIFMPTGTYVDWGPALEVAMQMNIPISGWMSSYLSARFFFGHVRDRHRVIYQSISNLSWDNIVRSVMTEVQQSRLDNYIHARYFGNKSFDMKKKYIYVDDIDRIDNIQDGRKKIGLLAHLNWDLAAEGSPMAYPTFNDWIIDTLNTITDIKNVQWLIKIHPAEAWESPETGVLNVIKNHFERIPPHIKIIHADDNISPLNFIQLVDVGVTVYGTAGLELALLGKPVILAGEAHYGGKGFTYDGLTPESYRRLLKKAATLPPLNPEQLLLAKKYAYCYFIQRQIPFPVVYDPESSWWKYQPHKVPLLLPGRDPFTDFICERILDGQDFIMPENLVLLAEKVYAEESSSDVSIYNSTHMRKPEVITLRNELETQQPATTLKGTLGAVPTENSPPEEGKIDMKPILGFDSAGEVFTHDGYVYRGVFAGHGREVQAVYDLCRDSNLFGTGIVNTTLVDRAPFNRMGYDLIMQHERVPFISYAHEWTPSMLKDAALFQIDLSLKLLDAGLLLKDCGVSTNVLFDGTRPVFVDFLSIIPEDHLTDEEWLTPDPAARQHYEGFSQNSQYFFEIFRRMFFPGLLFPLYLIHQNSAQATRKRLLETALNTTGDSITELETFVSAARPLYFTYQKYRLLQEAALRKEDLKQFLLIQRHEIEELNASMSQSGYADYYESKGENFDFFPSDAWKPKHWGVYNALQNLKPSTVLDIGANTGWFSILAAKQGAKVVSIDNDVACMDILYRRAKQEGLSILPLIVDFLDPTPDVAALAELSQEPHLLHSRFENDVPLLLSAEKRIACDMVIALAIVHHLCLGGGRHLDDVTRQLALFANKHLVLEFVTKDDPLIVGEPDFFKAQYSNPAGFDWYSLEECLVLLSRFFGTIQQKPLSATRILLVCTDKIETVRNGQGEDAGSRNVPHPTAVPTNANEFMELKQVLESPPTTYVVGITNICNLRCPLCVTGLRQQKKNPQFMEFGLFQQIIEKIRHYAQLVQLYKWGESLLHPRIIDMLAVCDSYDLNTEISSNLSVENCDDVLEALVRFRLRHLIVSFDGVTQEDYSRYRVGGELDVVLANISKIKEFKVRYNSEYPLISLQFLRNKFTGDQVQIIEDNYRQWGADKYYVCDMTTVFKDRNLDAARHWFSDQEIAQRKYLDIDVSMHGKPCHFLYNTMIIEQDGSIPSCCFATDPKDDFGRWDNSKSILEMYNSDRFIQARTMFREKKHCRASTCDDCCVFTTCLGESGIVSRDRPPTVSVIIPTYNRAKMLGITIESFVNQDYAPGSFEIIIADNNSTDNTREVVADWQSRSAVPITYLFEQRQGVHYARNSAAKKATGEILYFTDDDMIADSRLLAEIVSVFSLDPMVGTVTGRVLPRWEIQPPDWVLQLCYNSLLSIFDSLGDGIHIDEVDFGVYSCHQAIRKDALFKAGGFNPESTYTDYVGDGETGLSIKLKDNGYKFGYNGKSIIHHMIPASRMTQDYLNKRLANQGSADCYTEYKKHLFSSEQLANRVQSYVDSLIEKSSLCVDKRLEDNIRWRMDKAYTHYYLSRIEYDLRLIKDPAWRELVLKSDWIN